MTATSDVAARPDLARIRTYYDETWLDYRLLWLNPTNYAIHFGYWDDATHTHAEALNRLNAVLAKRACVAVGARVLDAGCGVGGSAIWLARTFSAKVTGITPVRSQVERARRFAVQQGVAGLVRFEEGDYARTSFPDRSFDVVWAMESLCHSVNKQAFYEEAWRLLRAGGRLAIVEYMRTRRPLGDECEALLQSWLSGWAIPDIATADEHRQWAHTSGFHDVELIDITSNVRPSLKRLHRMAAVAWPEAAMLNRLQLRTEAQLGNVRGARDQFRALEQGLWFDAMLIATAG